MNGQNGMRGEGPPRVLFVDSNRFVAGGEKDLIDFVNALKQTPVVEPFVSCPGEGPLATAIRAAGVPVFLVPLSESVGPLHRKSRLLGRLLDYLLMPMVVWQLTRIARRHRISMLHCTTKRANILGTLVSQVSGVPVIWTIHDFASTKGHIVRRLSRQATRILVSSETLRSACLAEGFPPQKLHPLSGMNVDTVKFSPEIDGRHFREELGIDPETPLVGLISRLHPARCLDVLIAAAAIVRQSLPQARFVIVGDDGTAPGYRCVLEQQIETLGLDGTVGLLGFRTDISRILAALDAAAFPAADEPTGGRATIEAMASGKPVICVDDSGPREIVRHGETGFLVPPRDAQALARALVQILTDHGFARELGARARQFVLEHQKVEQRVQKTYVLYQELLGVSRKGSVAKGATA